MRKKMVFAFLMIAWLALLSVISVYAEEATDASGQWKYVLEDGGAVITGCVEESPAGDLMIPGTVDGYLVTGIGVAAFDWCDGLTSVTIPDSVTHIGRYAFAYAYGNLTSVTIPDSVTSIGEYAFYLCTGLESITIPDSVTAIHGNPFVGCPLTAVNISSANPAYTVVDGVVFDKRDNTLVIFPRAKKGEYEIPQGTVRIGDSAFEECDGITDIFIPDSVTGIGLGAFTACNGLTRVTIPGSVTDIGEFAFWVCENLASVTILDGVTSIGAEAFEYCQNLISVTIPASVSDIGEYTFDACENVVLSVKEGSYAEEYAEYNDIPYKIDGMAPDNFENGGSADTDGQGAFVLVLTGETALANSFDHARELRFTEKFAYAVLEDGSVIIRKQKPVYVDGYEAIECGAFAYILKDGLANVIGFSGSHSSPWDWMYPPDRTDKNIAGHTDSLESALALYEPDRVSKETEPKDDDGSGIVWIDDDDHDKGYTLVIPDRLDGHPVVAIYDGAFEESGFRGVTLPNGLTSIGEGAFGACYDCETVIIPDGVTAIGDYAFQLGFSLTDVTIPESVTSIEDNAFYKCENVVLTVKEGSYAERYAKENGLCIASDEASAQPDALTDLTILEDWDTGMVLGAALTSEGMLLAGVSEYYWIEADGWLAFIDKEGKESWSLGEGDELYLRPTPLANGGFAVLCKREFYQSLDGESVSLMILNQDGVMMANPPLPRYARDIVVVGDSIFVLGNQETEDGDGEPAIGEPFLARFTGKGELLWTQSYTHPDYASLKFQKAVYAEDSLIIGANADVAESGLGICALYRCDLDGDFMWAVEYTPEISNECFIIDLCVNDDGIIAMVCGEYVYDEEYGEPLDRMCDVFGRNMDGDALWNYKRNGAMADYILPVPGGFLCVSQGLDLYNCPYLGDGWSLLLDENGNVKAADGTPEIGGGRYEIFGMARGVSGEAFLYGALLNDPGFPGAPFVGRLIFPEAYD